jgi:peptidoglycan L-alanyl-D-glutamate endopeptidase CwlK
MSGRSTDLDLLHPAMRSRVTALLSMLAGASIPLRVFEAWRGPDRQGELYMRGRVDGYGKPGRHVTQSRPWEGRHQYGLAADFVFQIAGQWTWAEPRKGMWDKFDRLAREVDLESVSFERPHVQLAGVRVSDLLAGVFPPGGDAPWERNLRAAALAWGRDARLVHGLTFPGAPPIADEADGDAEAEDLDADGRVWTPPPGMVYDPERGICVPL